MKAFKRPYCDDGVSSEETVCHDRMQISSAEALKASRIQPLERCRKRVVVRNAHPAGKVAYLDASIAPFPSQIAERLPGDAAMFDERAG